MNIPLDEVIHFDAITSDSTGAAVDADSVPVFNVFEEATDTPILSAQNFTKRTGLDGNYRGTATLSTANGFEVGKWYSVIASATVDGVTGKAALKNFRVVAAEEVSGVPKVDVGYVDGEAATPEAFPTVVEIRTEMDDNSTKLAAILLDTAEIGAAGAGLTAVATQVWAAGARTLTAATNITSDGSTLMMTASGYVRGDFSSINNEDVALTPEAALNFLTLFNNASGVATLTLDTVATAASVWSNGTRTLTAGTNIVLAKGTGVTGFNDLSAAQVNTEVDTALTDYDPPTRAEATADKDAILAQLPAAPVKNSAFTYVVKMVDATDGMTPETGLTITVTRSIDGAAFAAATGTVSEISTGHYKYIATAADMNGDFVVHRFAATGAQDLTMGFLTVS